MPQADLSWVHIKADGHTIEQGRALEWLLRRSPLFFWVGWLLQRVRRLDLAQRAYDWLGRQRDDGGLARRRLPWRRLRLKQSLAEELFVGFLAVSVLLMNVQSVGVLKQELPEAKHPLTSMLGLNQ